MEINISNPQTSDTQQSLQREQTIDLTSNGSTISRRGFTFGLSSILLALASTEKAEANPKLVSSLEQYNREVYLEQAGQSPMEIKARGAALQSALYNYLQFSSLAYDLNLSQPLQMDKDGTVNFNFSGDHATFQLTKEVRSLPQTCSVPSLSIGKLELERNVLIDLAYALQSAITKGDIVSNRKDASERQPLDYSIIIEATTSNMYTAFYDLVSQLSHSSKMFRMQNKPLFEEAFARVSGYIDSLSKSSAYADEGLKRCCSFIQGLFSLGNNKAIIDEGLAKLSKIFELEFFPKTLCEVFCYNKTQTGKNIAGTRIDCFENFSAIDPLDATKLYGFSLQSGAPVFELGALRRASLVLGIDHKLPQVSVLFDKNDWQKCKICLSFKKDEWMLVNLADLDDSQLIDRTYDVESYTGRAFVRNSDLSQGDSFDSPEHFQMLESYKGINLGKYIASAVYIGMCINENSKSGMLETFHGKIEDISKGDQDKVMLTNRTLGSIGWNNDFMREFKQLKSTAKREAAKKFKI